MNKNSLIALSSLLASSMGVANTLEASLEELNSGTPFVYATFKLDTSNLSMTRETVVSDGTQRDIVFMNTTSQHPDPSIALSAGYAYNIGSIAYLGADLNYSNSWGELNSYTKTEKVYGHLSGSFGTRVILGAMLPNNVNSIFATLGVSAIDPVLEYTTTDYTSSEKNVYKWTSREHAITYGLGVTIPLTNNLRFVFSGERMVSSCQNIQMLTEDKKSIAVDIMPSSTAILLSIGYLFN